MVILCIVSTFFFCNLFKVKLTFFFTCFFFSLRMDTVPVVVSNATAVAKPKKHFWKEAEAFMEKIAPVVVSDATAVAKPKKHFWKEA